MGGEIIGNFEQVETGQALLGSATISHRWKRAYHASFVVLASSSSCMTLSSALNCPAFLVLSAQEGIVKPIT